MQKKHFYVKTVTIGLVFVATALLPLPVRAEQCYSACKEGSSEYSGGVSWMCVYDRVGNYTGHGNVSFDNFSHATCRLNVKGEFSNLFIEIGRVKSLNECLTEKCIPKVQEICGELDRCSDPKNWRRW